MARLEINGLYDLIKELNRMGELTGALADAMIAVGAEQVRKAWVIEAAERDFRDTGDMIYSIGWARRKKNQTVDAVTSADIYPIGKDRDGTRNAEKAFLLHYGWSDFNPTYWCDDADRAATPDAVEAMAKIMDQFIETGKVPEIKIKVMVRNSRVSPSRS